MRGAALVAIAAAIGNALQGWDNSNIAGAVMYIKQEFNLQNNPTVEGLIVAMSLIGGTTITMLSGPMSDCFGRRPMLVLSSIFFILGGLVMTWSPNVYVLLLARLLDGFGTGLAVTLVPVYISETAPSDIRGQLNTLPQFTGSAGMFFSYSMVFGMSLMDSPNWRLMLGFISFPSLIFFLLTLFYLPESPRWLVSKGRMVEARQVLQKLRGYDQDVTGELSLLVEGLGTNGETSLEEYRVGDDHGDVEDGSILISKTVNGGGHSSLLNIDPLVNLFGSVHEKASESITGSMRSLIYPYLLGSSVNGEENEDFVGVGGVDSESSDDSDDNNLNTPLLSCGTMSVVDKDIIYPETIVGSGGRGEIGGGWQLGWKRCEKVGEDGKKEEILKRVYMHNVTTLSSSSQQQLQRGSIISVEGSCGDMASTAALSLISRSNMSVKDFFSQQKGHGQGQGQGDFVTTSTNTPSNKWKCLSEPGVNRALVVGIGLQILQQVSGINGVLYYAPQILEQAGVPLLLSNLGISSTSSSLLISALTTLLMLPCIGVSIWLMDIAGRRCLLLSTIPILVASLTFLVLGSAIEMSSILKAMILTSSLVVYLCCFVMSFGVIPNILCSEIFPTHARGLCITLCSLTYWIGNMMVTYSFPVMLKAMGLGGVFGIYVIGCIVSWIFVFVKVPETKGMPLEVISDFFAVDVKKLPTLVL